MPTMEQVLRQQIARLAKRETKKLLSPLKTQLTQLRRKVRQLKQQNQALAKLGQRRVALPPVAKPKRSVITPQRIQGLRKRLGLSLAKFAALLGVNMNSVWNWEQGKTKPNTGMTEKIIRARGIKRRAVKALLAERRTVEG